MFSSSYNMSRRHKGRAEV